MEIELRDLMDKNEMLSHIFLVCMKPEDLEKIRSKFVTDIDWQKESCKIPVEMKIGGISVNPKEFFDQWNNQMSEIISKEANKLFSEKLGSSKFEDLKFRLNVLEETVKYFEDSITWDSKNPFEETDYTMKLTVFNKKLLTTEEKPANEIFDVFNFIRISVIVNQNGFYEDENFYVYNNIQ